MDRVPSSRRWVGLFFAGALCSAATGARAETYTFDAGPYTVVTDFSAPCAVGGCANFHGAMRISGTLTTSAPLPPNLVAQPVRSLLTGLRFTDGLNSFDLGDPQLRMRRADISTDAAGAVTGIDFLVQRWATPGAAHAAGDRLDMIRIATGASTAFNNLFCNRVDTTVDADSCQSVGLDASTSRADGPGAPVALLVPVRAQAVPTLDGGTLALLATLLLLGSASRLRRTGAAVERIET